jgi:predicted AAA+ superfamily ATPase
MKKESILDKNNIFLHLKKYNFWEKSPQIKGLLREKYLSRLSEYLGNGLIKVLLGQRRVGKSYVMQQLISLLHQKNIPKKNIFYLNTEIFALRDIKTAENFYEIFEFYKEQMQPKGKIYIFLDEVQEIKNWEKIINSFSQDHVDEYELFITGSNSHLLSGELATYLTGRYISLTIFPFTYDEYIQFFQKEKNKTSYLQYLQTGGLPEFFSLPSDELKTQYIHTLKDSILLHDIVERHKIKDVELLESLFYFLIDNIGNLFSLNSVVQYISQSRQKTNPQTISQYINFLEQSFLLHSVDRYDIKGKKILSSKKKYYANDVGFRNFFFSSFDPGLGKHLENTLFLEYKSRGYSIYTGEVSNNEVDFILEKNGMKKYIQVTHSLTTEKVIEREFRSLEKIKDSFPKEIISLDDVSFGQRNGIIHRLAWEI